MYHALIVEDSETEKEALERCIVRYGENNDTEFRISWVASALEFMESHPQADVIFMDIDMPGLTGMEAAEHLRTYDTETPLVFVTNLAQYAVHGYAVDALDFIVKPVTYGPFALRMGRVMRELARRAPHMVSVPTRDGVHTFSLRDVAFVDIDGHYLRYHLADGEVVRTRGSMREAQTTLEGSFVRVSNNELVNAVHVRRVRHDEVELDTGESIYFSRARKKDAQMRIAQLLGGHA